MKLQLPHVLQMVVAASCKEGDKDNKAMDSKGSTVSSLKESEKINKNEKRAPLVMTAVAGELKFAPDMKYGAEFKYRPDMKYAAQPDLLGQSQFLAAGTQTVKPQYLMYSPPPQPPQMVLMLAVPHPSGQFLMLLPAQNLIYPMFYRPPPPLAPLAPVPIPSYQTPSYQQTQPTLSQAAGFVAQHQLSYSGPYRSDKYISSKQN
ncbi:uncharacterized protein isoform X1 [Rhodnius prolixus]|uniref:uncharacterized protein isoform X1 n=1 Tax=Rhodnius prolixus TaxID=13249 RepID=UPI003D18CB70